MKTVFFDDKERLEFLSSSFPQGVAVMMYERICSGWATERDFDTLINYLEGTMQTIGLKFTDKKIQSAYEDFNEKTENLSKFMEDNLHPVKIKRDGKVILERYEIPDPRRDDYFDQEKEEVRIAKLEEIARVASSFSRSYVNLMKTGMRQLEHGSSSPASKSKKVETSFVGRNVQFDEAQPAILIDQTVCKLPPALNEAALAKVIFGKKIGEYMDWEAVFNDMDGSNSNFISTKKHMRMVQDTVYRINKRLQSTTEVKEDLLSWKNKSVCRNY